MKKYSYLIVIFSLFFNTIVKADDIRDFEIEGISIGDSLLDYFNKDKIIKIKSPNKKLEITYARMDQNLKTYDFVKFWWFDKDKDYNVVGIAGELIFNNDLKGCKKKQNEIADNIKDTLTNFTINKNVNNYFDDKSGESKVYHYSFKFKSGDNINIQCYIFSKDYKKKVNFIDNLRVMIVTKEMNDHYRIAHK